MVEQKVLGSSSGPVRDFSIPDLLKFNFMALLAEFQLKQLFFL